MASQPICEKNVRREGADEEESDSEGFVIVGEDLGSWELAPPSLKDNFEDAGSDGETPLFDEPEVDTVHKVAQSPPSEHEYKESVYKKPSHSADRVEERYCEWPRSDIRVCNLCDNLLSRFDTRPVLRHGYWFHEACLREIDTALDEDREFYKEFHAKPKRLNTIIRKFLKKMTKGLRN